MLNFESSHYKDGDSAVLLTVRCCCGHLVESSYFDLTLSESNVSTNATLLSKEEEEEVFVE